MTSRTNVDRPAMLVTAVLAVALIAASAPFTYLWWGEGTTEYDVSWAQASVGTPKSITVTGAAAQTTQVEVVHQFVAAVSVTMKAGACQDTPGLGNSAATISWTLTVRYANGTTNQVDNGSFTCASASSGFNETTQRGARPTLGAREVESGSSQAERDAARAAIWDNDLLGSLNETSSYILTASASRPASTIPGPLAPVPSLSAILTLDVYRWASLLQASGSNEVVR